MCDQIHHTKHQMLHLMYHIILNPKRHQVIYAVLSQVLSQIYAVFWRTFFRPEKYVGVPKMTIIRYECVVKKRDLVKKGFDMYD